MTREKKALCSVRTPKREAERLSGGGITSEDIQEKRKVLHSLRYKKKRLAEGA